MANPMIKLERAILAELRKVENDKGIKSNSFAWQLGSEIRPDYIQSGDKVVHLTLPEFGNQPVTVAYTPKLKL